MRDLEAEAHLQMCDAGVPGAAVPEEVDSLLVDVEPCFLRRDGGVASRAAATA